MIAVERVRIATTKYVVTIPVTDRVIREADEDFEAIMGMTRAEFAHRIAEAARP